MKRISFGSVLSGGLWLWYDHMASLALANLLWLVLSLGVVTIPLATAGLCAYTYSLFSGREESLKAFFAGMRKFWWRATLLGLIHASLILVSGINLSFYLLKASQWSKPLGMLGAGLFLWVGIGLAGLGLYLYPLLCHYEKGWKRMLKTACLIALANPFLLLALLVFDILLFAACLVSGIGAVFIMAGLASALNTLAVVEALVMYEGVDKESELAQRLEGCHEDWKKRNFRYLIRPWE